MTEHQRILALEAALCACEGACPTELHAAMSNLQNELDRIIDNRYGDKSMGEFLADQRAAVHALASNPAVFGADDWQHD